MDNTVGSLTQFQKSVVIGSILGDGYLRRIKGRKDAFLEVNHSIKQKEYVVWKYNVLKNVAGGFPKARRGNGTRVAYRFYTKQLSDMTELMQHFYQEKIKIIPIGLELNPVILAVWFMDDGSMCRETDIYLNTQQFDVKDQVRLLRILKDCGLEGRLNRDKKYHRIRFLKSSIPRLQKIIGPYIIPSMHYKLSYDPVETTRRSPTLQIVG